jgi:hypothetical protein
MLYSFEALEKVWVDLLLCNSVLANNSRSTFRTPTQNFILELTNHAAFLWFDQDISRHAWPLARILSGN